MSAIPGEVQPYRAILDAAARAFVAGGGVDAALGDIERVQRGQDVRARALVTALRQSLSGVLAGLTRQLTSSAIDASSLGEAEPQGMPAPDVGHLRDALGISVPVWASWLPPVARWLVRRRIERRCGDQLRGWVETHGRQVRAWTDRNVRRMAEQFELQAEPIREMVRGEVAGVPDADDSSEALREDVTRLREAVALLHREFPIPLDARSSVGDNPSTIS